MAAAATLARLSRMLPLSSMRMPMDTGTSSRLKSLIDCSFPFSKTLNEFWGKLFTSLPLLSTTVACSTTRRVSVLMIKSSCANAIAATAAQTTNSRAGKIHRRALTGRCIVTKSEKCFQGWQPTRLHERHFDAPVLPVPVPVLGRVSDDILVSELYTNFSGNVRQLVQILDRKCAPAGLFGQFVQQAGAVHLLGCSRTRRHTFENPDGIELDVRFSHRVLDFALGIAAGIVATIGNDENGLARIVRLLHFIHSEVNSIEQSGPSLGLCEGEPVLQLLRIPRERHDEVRPVVELDQEELVLGVGDL